MSSALVVDDSDAIQVILSDFLELLGMHVTAKAFDGKDAVEKYQMAKPDIVFLDISMPKYDGIYALQEIKKFDPNANVVIVTADNTYETQNKVMELGAIGIILKPFSLDDIKNIILTINPHLCLET